VQPRYAERLTPPWWMWVLVLFMALSLGIAVLLPAGLGVALAVTVLSGALCGWALLAWSARIEIDDGQLRAGRARIPVDLLGRVDALDAEQAAYLRGPGIDPRAYHLLRGWVPTAVTATVTDPGDPTPYWYLSTRRPRELAAALEAAIADERRTERR
jgi:hypothetical protein